jgi:hypothetical protein
MTYTVGKIEGIGNDSGSVRGWLTEAGWVENGEILWGWDGDMFTAWSTRMYRTFRDENEK